MSKPSMKRYSVHNGVLGEDPRGGFIMADDPAIIAAKAGALIAAEIDRLQRLGSKENS